jgi:hypothetical protein
MENSRRQENTLVAILFFTWGTVFLDRTSQHDLPSFFAPEFHLSHEQIGLWGSMVAVTWAISTLPFGALSDRIGRKPILVSVRRRGGAGFYGRALPERNVPGQSATSGFRGSSCGRSRSRRTRDRVLAIGAGRSNGRRVFCPTRT